MVVNRVRVLESGLHTQPNVPVNEGKEVGEGGRISKGFT